MKTVRIWMIAVGVFYLLNLVLLWPPLWAGQLPGMYPGVALMQDEPVFQLLLDAWLIVGIQLAALGAALLWGAVQDPIRYAVGLIPAVIFVELVDMAWDIYSAMGYEELNLAMTTVVIHLIIIGSTIWVRRKLSAV